MVKVYVVRSARDGFFLRWRCPKERRIKEQRVDAVDRADAERMAAELATKVAGGYYTDPARVTWLQFREAFREQHLSSVAPRTRLAYEGALGWAERVLRPRLLVEVDAQGLSLLQVRLRGEGLSESTNACYLRHVRSALAWGKQQRLLVEVPTIRNPKRRSGDSVMKGRPITPAEFEKMLAAVHAVRSHDAHAWLRLLRGLWLSGLRISEAVALSWEIGTAVAVDLTGGHPAIRFEAEGQKSRRAERVPVAPDFGAFLLAVPPSERRGKVFPILGDDGQPVLAEWVGKMVCRFGKAARIVVSERLGKYASAHDLRRSFGTRWAKKLPVALLKRLMRHQSITTTMAYYASLEADDMNADLWERFGKIGPASGESGGEKGPEAKKQEVAIDVKECEIQTCQVPPDGLEPSTL